MENENTPQHSLEELLTKLKNDEVDADLYETEEVEYETIMTDLHNIRVKKTGNLKKIKKIEINISVGKEKRKIIVRDSQQEIINDLMNFSLKGIVCLKDYSALWNQEKQEIICLINDENRYRMNHSYEEYKSIEASIKDIKVNFDYCNEMEQFVTYRMERRPIRRNPNIPIIRISNITCRDVEEAEEKLEKISQSILFGIKVKNNVLLSLRKRPERSFFQEDTKINNISSMNIMSYNNEPLSLYLNSCKSDLIDLYKYLGFYQVIEFYFPIFSTKETIVKIQNKIKNPLFDWNQEKDILNLISLIQNNKSGSTMDEKNQLESVLRACVNPEEVCQYIENEKLADFILDKDEGLKLSSKSLAFKKDKETKEISLVPEHLIGNLTSRIYDIRNKIVHKKASGDRATTNEVTSIHPFSNEEKLLSADLKIIEYIAQQVLIFNGKKMEL